LRRAAGRRSTLAPARTRPRGRTAARAADAGGPGARGAVHLGRGRGGDGTRAVGRRRGAVVSTHRPPRVGIDARKLTDFGIGSYVRNLLEAIARRPESRAYRFRVYVRGDDLGAVPAL